MNELVYFHRTHNINDEIKTYLSTGFLTDLTIICRSKIFRIHKLVLAVTSQYLWDILDANENIEQLILSEFEEEEIESFIDNLYQVSRGSNLSFSHILETLKIGKAEPFILHPEIKEEPEVDIQNFTIEVDLPDHSIDNTLHENIEDLDLSDDNNSNDYHKLAKGKVGRPRIHPVKAKAKVKKQKPSLNISKVVSLKVPAPNQKEQKCRICQVPCESRTELINHRKEVHGISQIKQPKGIFTCELCGQHCGTRNDMRLHIRNACPKCTIPCSHCPRRFRSNKAVETHTTKWHDPDNHIKNLNKYNKDRYICPVCGKSMLQRDYDYHVATHDPKADLSKFEKWQCEECGKKFAKSKSQASHGCVRNAAMFHDNDGNLLCTLCLQQCKNKKEIVAHKKEAHPEKCRIPYLGTFQCPVQDCEIEKKQLNQIKIHLEQVHFRVRKSKCPHCPARFETSMHKRKHIVQFHKVTADFQCDTCGQEFLSSYKLKFHVYVNHTDERRYKCNYCEKAFKQNGELKRHLFVHEAHLSKYECELCGKKFRDKSTLSAHRNTHTGERPFKCSFCTYSAASLPALHVHRTKCARSTQLVL